MAKLYNNIDNSNDDDDDNAPQRRHTGRQTWERRPDTEQVECGHYGVQHHQGVDKDGHDHHHRDYVLQGRHDIDERLLVRVHDPDLGHDHRHNDD